MESLEKVFVPEMNLGQLVLDIERLAPVGVEVVPINKIGGGEPIYPEEIVGRILNVCSY